MHRLFLALSLGLSTPALAGPGLPGSYTVPYGQATLPGPFNLSKNCVGCPKGSPTGLAPAVYEFVLALEGSPVREHYSHEVRYTLGEIKGALAKNNTSKNPGIRPMYTGDLEYMVAESAGLLTDITGASDREGQLAASTDGVAIARAAGAMTAEASNKILAKQGRAMWLRGARLLRIRRRSGLCGLSGGRQRRRDPVDLPLRHRLTPLQPERGRRLLSG